MGLVFTVTCHSGVSIVVRIVGDLNAQTRKVVRFKIYIPNGSSIQQWDHLSGGIRFPCL